MTRSADLEQVADSFDRLVGWIRRQTPSGVSASAVTTLDTLRANGPLRVSDLAQREALTQPGMTTLINRLERQGYAQRVADPTDGRAALVRITPAGESFLADRRRVRSAALVLEFERRLDADDQDRLVAALPAIERLIDSVRAERVPQHGTERTTR